MLTSKNKSTGDDSIEPGTPFPEPEVKPVDSQTPVNSQGNAPVAGGITDGSVNGDKPAS